jgi:membrane associated rhomboid family serine protease
MLEDRSYMRAESLRVRWPFTLLLLIVNVAVFALQEINAAYLHFPVGRYLALSNEGLRHGYLWQLLTFQFLHGGGWHLVLNCVGLYFFGRAVEERLGRAAFLKVYLLSGVAGGLFQALLGALLPVHFRMEVLGASAGVYGLIAAATVVEPNAVILLSFIIPVKAKYFLFLAAGISLFYIFVPDSGIAHGAHLGGLMAGYAYVRWGMQAESIFLSRRLRRPLLRPRELIQVRSQRETPWRRAKTQPEDLSPTEFISREVDPILDKISAHGIQSLTPRERQILEKARAKMERR